MSIYFRNPNTGQYEQIKIPIMKGETGVSGIHAGSDEPATVDVEVWFDPSDKSIEDEIHERLDELNVARVGYMGDEYESVKDAMDANVEYTLEHLYDEVNTMNYEGTSITANHTIERQVKGATLKGRTLVNLVVDPKEEYSYAINGDYSAKTAYLESGKTYTFQADIETVGEGVTGQFVRVNYTDGSYLEVFYDSASGSMLEAKQGRYQVCVTIPDNKTPTGMLAVGWQRVFIEGNDIIVKNLVVVEGDYADIPIPYFEGATSVKNPVLRSAGKNIANTKEFVPSASILEVEFIDNSIAVTKTAETGGGFVGGYFTLKKETQYSIQYVGGANLAGTKHFVFVYCDKPFGTILATFGFGELGYRTFTTSNQSTPYYIGVYVSLSTAQGETLVYDELIITEGEQAGVIPYEPYKSNILSPVEDVELCSVGSVSDTLNCITGEVTSNIKHHSLTGAYWFAVSGVTTDTNLTYYCVPPGRLNGIYTCDKLSVRDHFDRNQCGLAYTSNKYVYFTVNKSDLASKTMVQYVDELDLTVSYPAATPTVKTVGLTNKPVAYEDVTHYAASSDTFAPAINIDVPTNLTDVIGEQQSLMLQQQQDIDCLSQENESLKTTQDDLALSTMAYEFDTEFRLMMLESGV